MQNYCLEPSRNGALKPNAICIISFDFTFSGRLFVEPEQTGVFMLCDARCSKK